MQQSNSSVGATSATLLDVDPTGGIDYIMVQNNHASQILYLNFAGATATTANSIKVAAGEAFEHHFRSSHKTDITCIGSGASTTYVLIYE